MPQFLPKILPPGNSSAKIKPWLQAQLETLPKWSPQSRSLAAWMMEDFGPQHQDLWNQSELLRLFQALDELRNGRPYAYICGKAPFLNVSVGVNPSVLIPRPETEEWVDMLLNEQPEHQLSVLDIGTGSGCIALACAKAKPTWQVHAVDVSAEALQTAQANAKELKLSVSFYPMDLNEKNTWPKATFDVICSNPPYIPEDNKSRADPDVRDFEPHIALFTPKNDPLWFYRAIIHFCSLNLNPGGWLYLETDGAYHNETKDLLLRAGLFSQVKSHQDFRGNLRCISAKKSS